MRRRLVLPFSIIALAATCVVDSGCGSARRSEPIKGAASIADPATARGRIVYMDKCNRCHPGGEAGLGPALNDKPLPEPLMKTQIRAGLGAMPAFPSGEISDADVDAIIAYLKAMRRADANRCERLFIDAALGAGDSPTSEPSGW
jgi:mono/diheme cytochrome c family protein